MNASDIGDLLAVEIKRPVSALLGHALTHNALTALGFLQWRFGAIDDARQVIVDRYGHRDGPGKKRHPPVELKLLDGARWGDMGHVGRLTLLQSYFAYLDIHPVSCTYQDVDPVRGQMLFGEVGWAAVSTACDLIVKRPSTAQALDSYRERLSYQHPEIRRRIERLHLNLSRSLEEADERANHYCGK